MVSITKDHFSIRQICESGQCFRLERLDGEEDIYYETKTFRAAKKAQTAPIKFFVGFF